MHHAMINKGKMINKERLAEFLCCTKAQAAGRGQAAAGVGMVQAHTAWAGAVLWAPPGTQEMAQGHCWGTAGALQPQPELQDCSGFLLAAAQLA